jgi:DNA-binding GntR family transcriptional regulator
VVQTTEKRAYDHLRRKLAGGSLPPGSRVSAVAMAKEIGVSATPVTQAIRRLEIEGLIELIPHLGTFVKKPDLREVEDLYDLRIALETHAVARAIGRLSEADLTELDAACRVIEDAIPHCRGVGARRIDAETLRLIALADLKFHATFVHASGNRRIIKLMEDSHLLMRGILTVGDGTGTYWAENLRTTAELHRGVLDAIRRADRRAARKAMTLHLRDSIREARNYLGLGGSRPDSGASSVFDIVFATEPESPADR